TTAELVLDRALPAYAALTAGKAFSGRTPVLGKYYIGTYSPILNGGVSVGAVFVGLEFEEATRSLKEKVRSVKIGDTGYPYVLENAPGKDRGTLVIHPAQEGKNIIDSKDSDGRLFIQDMLNRGNGVTEYPWINKERGETSPRLKIAAFNSYDPWNWVVGSGSYLDELTRDGRMLVYLAAGLIVGLSVILLGVFYFLTRRLVLLPVDELRGIIRRVAQGDFRESQTSHVVDRSKDEVSRLKKDVLSFRAEIRALVQKIQAAVDELAASSSEMSATSETFARNAQGQSATSEEISAAVEEISAEMDGIADVTASQMTNLDSLLEQMRALTDTISRVETSVVRALDFVTSVESDARHGEESIGSMTAYMNNVLKSSGEMTAAAKIISDISDQINLLSLNASIEAARAGEQGRGFAVVATEISKLADQTAASIKDIDNLIQKSGSEIKEGISSVEDSVGIIRRIIRGVGDIAAAISEVPPVMKNQNTLNESVNTHARAVKERFVDIRNAAVEHRNALKEITESVGHINQLTQANAAGAEEMAATADSNARVAQTLKKETQFFKV
ncbi:MAG: Cache 3/Cache 2 fusion domain-containing protein, partial [Spirochaetia bacterium]|nr:Cache 3/Cache 2 fusion domain-containing protein [Spirochaetia bacterium]